ncbi:MAG: hypothetical protein JXA01_10630 [Dehalococcoidia bacterium]|nr:hypothetical protein [Dehalococcoidia bacterium]
MINKWVKFSAALASALILLILMFIPVQAADIRNGQDVVVGAGEVVNDDLYLSGSEVTVDAAVNGDVIAVGNRVIINGDVNGSIIAAASIVIINGRVSGSVRAAGNTVTIKNNIGNDVVSLAGVTSITPEAVIGRDFVAASGTVDVNGPVYRNIECNAGRLTINSSIGGSVSTEVSQVSLGPSASIQGNLEYTSDNEANIASGASIKGGVQRTEPEQAPADQTPAAVLGAMLSAVIAFLMGFMAILALATYAAALLAGIVTILISRKHLVGVVETLRNKPWSCLGWGALTAVLIPIAVAILCAIIVGIPLAAAGLAVYIIALYLSHIVTALWLGKWMLRKLAYNDNTSHLIGSLALGLLVIYVLCLIPFINILADLAAILFGFGAIIYYIKERPNLLEKASQTHS